MVQTQDEGMNTQLLNPACSAQRSKALKDTNWLSLGHVTILRVRRLTAHPGCNGRGYSPKQRRVLNIRLH